MLFAGFGLSGSIERQYRFVICDTEGGGIGNGVVHVQSTGSHFVPEEPGAELFKAPVSGRTAGQKSHGAGEGAEETDTYKQLGKRERRTFSHDDYLGRKVLVRVYVGILRDRLDTTYLWRRRIKPPFGYPLAMDSCTVYNYAQMYLKQLKAVLTLYGRLIILKVIMETKYQNLINYIQEQIADGQLGPGEKVPSENQLSERFHISRQTVRKAIGTLEEDGLVQRIRGSGTYVSFDRRKNLEQRNSIAVVTTYVDSYIFPKILQGIQNTLFESGFSVQIYFTNNTLDREKSILKDLLKRDDVAGVIVEGTKSGLPNPNLDLYRHLMARKIPLLFFNTYYPELEAPHVSLNDADTAYKAVRYLIDKGHEKIGAILKLDDGQGRQRYLGYLRAMEEAGLMVTDSRMVWIDTDESKQLGFCLDRILNRVQECTALLAYNDQIAFQLIRMLTERHIRVPEDVSVISIDDSDLARHSEVPITSLPHPKENLGKKAAETLLQMIAGKKKDLTYEFDTRVVERESVTEYKKHSYKTIKSKG